MSEKRYTVQAIVEPGQIIIRLPLAYLQAIVDGGYDAGIIIRTPLEVTDPDAFAKELVNVLNVEDERGDSMVHKMIDRAIEDAANNGADGLAEAPVRQLTKGDI